MQLKRDGFVMRMAYGYEGILPSAHVNVCPTFWRFVMRMIFLIPEFLVSFIFAARRPAIFKEDWTDGKREGGDYVVFSWWPKGKDFRYKDGNPIPPFMYLLLLALLAFILAAFSLVGYSVWMIISSIVKTSGSLDPVIRAVWSTESLTILLMTCSGFLLIRFSKKIWNSEPVLLVREFLRSRKERLCFLIEIKE